MSIATSPQAPPDRSGSQPSGPAPAIAGLAAVAGIGAVIVSSCCVVPLLLAGAGLSGAWLVQDQGLAASWQPYLMALAGISISAAWLIFLWRRRQSAKSCAANSACARPATPWITGAILVVATGSVAGALLWARLEPVVLGWLTN